MRGLRFWTDFVGGTHRLFEQIGYGCEGKRGVKGNSKVFGLSHQKDKAAIEQNGEVGEGRFGGR